MERLLFGLLIFVLILAMLAWLSGRLLGGRPSWWRALLSAWLGLTAGAIFAATVAAQSPEGIRSTNPLVIWVTTLLTSMATMVLFEFVARRAPAARLRARWGERLRPLRAGTALDWPHATLGASQLDSHKAWTLAFGYLGLVVSVALMLRVIATIARERMGE